MLHCITTQRNLWEIKLNIIQYLILFTTRHHPSLNWMYLSSYVLYVQSTQSLGHRGSKIAEIHNRFTTEQRAVRSEVSTLVRVLDAMLRYPILSHRILPILSHFLSSFTYSSYHLTYVSLCLSQHLTTVHNTWYIAIACAMCYQLESNQLNAL